MESLDYSIMAGTASTYRKDRLPGSSTPAEATTTLPAETTVDATASWSLQTPDGRSLPSALAMAPGDHTGNTSAGQTGIVTTTVWTSWLNGT